MARTRAISTTRCSPKPHADGFRLVVAIADVSHYVREGTQLDAEARERGTSVYFPRRVVPMLPPALSDELCSLKPQVDRFCLAADLHVSRTGQLQDVRFYPAVMRSHARLTYGQAFAALFEGRPEARAQAGPAAAEAAAAGGCLPRAAEGARPPRCAGFRRARAEVRAERGRADHRHRPAAAQ